MLRVYYTELSEAFQTSCPFPLSDYRTRKLAAVKAPQLRRQMIAAEWLLDQAVTAWNPQIQLPLELDCTEQGKPFFRDRSLSFSLSHSGPYIACALADFEIGLDVQETSRYNEALVKRFFSHGEQKYLHEHADSDAAFTAVWCLKESYIKACGAGLSKALSDFSVSMDSLTLETDEHVHFWQYGGPGFQMSVCALDGHDPTPEKRIKTELRL